MAAPDLRVILRSFLRAKAAANASPRTLAAYRDGVEQLAAYLERAGQGTALDAIAREQVEAFVADQLARWRPLTAAGRFNRCRVFFNWCVVEEELAVSPMARMQAPTVPETPPPVPETDVLMRLLKACEGRGYRDRRDLAILRMLLDTGMRRSECAGLRLTDLDLDQQVAIVMGKGSRPRACPFGRKATLALDRYLRVRAQHRHAATPWLWLGRDGALAATGLYEALRGRAARAGIPDFHPHLLRHHFAHVWLERGGQEQDLMRLTGWRSRAMLARYAASAADQRARKAYHREGAPGDAL